MNPHVANNGWLQNKEYHWITEPAEFASDLKQFQAVMSGSHELRGFQNPISELNYFANLVIQPNVAVRQHISHNIISRLLKRLHVRGLIAGFPALTAGESPTGAAHYSEPSSSSTTTEDLSPSKITSVCS